MKKIFNNSKLLYGGYWSNRLVLGVETVVLATIFCLLVFYNPGLMAYRHTAIFICFIYFGNFLNKEKKIIRHAFKMPVYTLVMTAIFSLLAAGGLWLLYPYFRVVQVRGISVFFTGGWTVWEIIISYILLSVPIQELLFRVIYIERLKMTGLPVWITVGFSALVFGALHLPFGNMLMTLGTLLGGWWWGYLYLKTKSIWPSVISHSILGSVFIYLAYQA